MKRTRVVLASIAVLAVAVSACTDAIHLLDPSDARTEGTIGGPGTSSNPFETPLLAGRTMEVGVVRAWNDETTLFLQYEMTEPGWCLFETHLHVAGSLDGIPRTRTGNPIPGRFDYKMRHDCATEFTQEIDLDSSWEPGTELFIAAHADVSNGEGAWGAGTRFVERGNWAMFFNFTVAEDDGNGDGDGVGGFAVRYRSFGNAGEADGTESDIFLGVSDLEPGGRTELDLGSTWARLPESNEVTFAYDAAADQLTTSVTIGSQTFDLDFPSASGSLTGCALADINRLVFTLDGGNTVVLRVLAIEGVTLSTELFSSGAGNPTVDEVTADQLQAVFGIDFDLTDGFTLTGVLELTGDFGSDPEFSFVEIAALCPASG